MDNVIDIKIYQEAKQIKENLDRKNMTIEDLDLDSISLEVNRGVKRRKKATKKGA